MGAQPPAQVRSAPKQTHAIFRWNVPGHLGDRAFTVAGRLDYVPPSGGGTSAGVVAAVVTSGIAAVLALALMLCACVAARRPRWSPDDPRPRSRRCPRLARRRLERPQRAAPLPLARSEVAAAPYGSGIVRVGGYVAGGTGDTARADLYLPARNRWRRLPDYPIQIDHSRGVALTAAAGALVAAGGTN